MASKQINVKLVVDKREQLLCEQLKALSSRPPMQSATLELEFRMLEVGDVVAGDLTVIERKTRSDFENSIIDGRLFMQLMQMERYRNRILIVEGTGEYSRLPRNAVIGAYASVCTKHGASLLFTKDIAATAEMVFFIAKHAQEAKEDLKLVADKRILSDSMNIRRIVESFPLIGPKAAKSLLNDFGSVKRIVNATVKELTSVDLIGEKKAEQLVKFFSQRYDGKEDSNGNGDQNHSATDGLANSYKERSSE